MVNKSTGKGRVCLVTGSASRGMGREEVKLMALEGARVVVSDIPSKDKEGKEVVAEIQAFGGIAIWVPMDVSSEQAWSDTIDKIEAQFGPLDVLVNNAGVGIPDKDLGGIENMTIEGWRKTQTVNVEGVFLGCKYAVKSMKKNTASEFCSIVNISSRAGFTGSPALIPYGASNWAVRGMTKSFAAYAAHRGYKIRVNSVHPGLIRTDMTRNVGWFDANDKATIPRMENAALLRRAADPVEVARMVVYLASDDASFCNAAEFLVDGGLL